MRLSALIFTACTLLSLLALAQMPPPLPPDMQRIFGTVEQWGGQTLTVKSANGEVRALVPADARINTRRKGTLADINLGSFVGSVALAGTAEMGISPVERSQLKPGVQINAIGRKGADENVTAQMVDVGPSP